MSKLYFLFSISLAGLALILACVHLEAASPANCYSIPMQNFAGRNTLSYPVGVFNINGNLLGNATTPTTYISLWNNDTADARLGSLALGRDSMHFNLNLMAGQSIPSCVTGLRYYQIDLPWNQIDGIRQFNCAYVDFGDGASMRMPAVETDTPAVHPPNTTYVSGFDFVYLPLISYYYVHNYPDTSLKTLTFYHNDGTENTDFDNVLSPATSLTKLRDLRGNLPANTNSIGGSSYQQASMTSLQGILNWNKISSVQYFRMNNGDFGINSCTNISYPQDFMANNKGLLSIQTRFGTVFGVADHSFTISRLKSNWNTYFTQLQSLSIAELDWSREDLSALTHLNSFSLQASDADGGISTTGPFTPLDSTEIDNAIIQIAQGAGQHVTNGVMGFATGGSGRTSASQSAINLLLSKGWNIVIDGVTQVSQ